MYSETVGEKIKKQRQEKGLSLQEVAQKIGCAEQTLLDIEQNKEIASITIVEKLADVLALDYKSLLIKYWSEKIFNQLKEIEFAPEIVDTVKRRLERKRRGTFRQMEREEMIQLIQDYFSDKPIEKAWLFGSFARNEESLDSDLDILIELEEPLKINLLDFIGFKQELEELTGREVDLVQAGQERPRLKPFIENDKILIYKRAS